MQIIPLYRYIRPDGGVTVSVTKPECEYTESFRLVADAGMVLCDGDVMTWCVDTDSPEAWTNTQDLFDYETTDYTPEEVDDIEAAANVFGMESDCDNVDYDPMQVVDMKAALKILGVEP